MNGLVGVLCRFRLEVALVANIKAMFHQFLVCKGDRDLLRFIWWKNGDTKKPVEEYRIKVHFFGAVSSPGCANFGLKRALMMVSLDSVKLLLTSFAVTFM